MNRIIVGVDGSECSETALAWAVREGNVHGLPVRAVLAWSLLDQHHADPDQEFDPHYGEAEALEAIDHFIHRAVEADDADRVERIAVCDLPARALLDASTVRDLLVVGARGLGGFKGLLLGSVSEQCLSHSTGPVAIVRDTPIASSGTSGNRIVVGIDGSDAGNEALRWAVTEARLRDAELEVVHAWHTPYTGVYGDAIGAIDPTPFEVGARTVLDRAVEEVGVGEIARSVKRTLASGSAAGAILSTAADADLVVVGTRGHGGFKGLLLGSVSHQVAHHATCPVVVVKESELKRSDVASPSD